MAPISLIVTSLKGFAAFWSLVTFAVAAAEVSKLNAIAGSSGVMASNFDGANVILATGLLAFLYFTAYLVVLLFVSSENIFVSLIIDSCAMGLLFILGLAGSATLSTESSVFNYYKVYIFAQLGQATIALGWILTFLILGILLTEVIVVLMHHGTDFPTWRSSFHDVVNGSVVSSSGRGVSSSAVETGATGAVPMSSVNAPATSTVGGFQAPATHAAPASEVPTAAQV